MKLIDDIVVYKRMRDLEVNENGYINSDSVCLIKKGESWIMLIDLSTSVSKAYNVFDFSVLIERTGEGEKDFNIKLPFMEYEDDDVEFLKFHKNVAMFEIPTETICYHTKEHHYRRLHTQKLVDLYQEEFDYDNGVEVTDDEKKLMYKIIRQKFREYYTSLPIVKLYEISLETESWETDIFKQKKIIAQAILEKKQ